MEVFTLWFKWTCRCWFILIIFQIISLLSIMEAGEVLQCDCCCPTGSWCSDWHLIFSICKYAASGDSEGSLSHCFPPTLNQEYAVIWPPFVDMTECRVMVKWGIQTWHMLYQLITSSQSIQFSRYEGFTFPPAFPSLQREVSCPCLKEKHPVGN